MFGCYSHWIYISTVLLLVNVNYAQVGVQVDVSFDPPSPVNQGIVTFKCEFTLPAGTVLAQQYWQIVNGDRFFEYVPGSDPAINPDYTDKVLSHDTDDTTYLEITFNVTACDVEQYLCNILANSSADNNDQQSLEVENMIEPTLMDGTTKVTGINNERPLNAAVNVSCTLNNAGPPLPELLEIEVTGGSLNSTSGVDYEQFNETCTWIYKSPVVIEVTDLDGVEQMKFKCRVDYTGRDSLYSPELTLIPLCLDFDCNNGTCMVEEGRAKCDCPTNIHGDRCNDTSCVNNTCSGPSTCDPEDDPDFDLVYSCNCTGYNLYGTFCNETGCNSPTESGCFCINDGICTDTLWNCSCDCPDGCSGPHCGKFDEGDNCPFCQNNISACIQTCDYYNCECDYNFNGTFCNGSCNLVTGNSFAPGTYNVTLGEPTFLYCDSDDANSIIWVDENENFVQNGSNLTIGVSYIANETSYFCRLMGPDCNQQIEYFLDVIPIDIEATENTTKSDSLSLAPGEDIAFIASIEPYSGPALSDPVITLCWLLDTESLNCSTSGTVEYFKPNVTEDDEGNYTAVATYLDYTQVLTSIYVDIACASGLNVTEQKNYNVSLNASITLFCDSDDTSSVWWKKDGSFEADGSVLVLNPICLADAGLYTCIINGSSCTEEVDYNVTVQEPVWDVILDENETENMIVNVTENEYLLECSIVLTSPLPVLNWTFSNTVNASICNISDDTIKIDDYGVVSSSISTSHYVNHTVTRATGTEGCYKCFADYLDANATLRAVFLSFAPENVPVPPGSGLTDWEIALAVCIPLLVLIVAGVIVYMKREPIIGYCKGCCCCCKDTGPSGESDKKKGRESHQMRGEDNKNHVNDSSQKENFHSESQKSKVRRGKVRQDPQWQVNQQRKPTGGERLPPIGKSEPEQTETSPKRKKKRRRRKAPDGQPDMSPGPEDRPRPLPVPSSSPSRRLPPIERIELERSPVYNGYESTPL